MEVEHNQTNQDVTQEEREDLSGGIGGSRTDSETIVTNIKLTGKTIKKRLGKSNNETPLEVRRNPSRRDSQRK